MANFNKEKTINITRFIYWDRDKVTECPVPKMTEQGAIKVLEMFKKMK